MEVNVKSEYTWTTRTKTPRFVDGLTYASMANEARTTRNQKAVYNDYELMMIADQLDPDIYPNVNWMDLLLKDGAPTYRASISAKEVAPRHVTTSRAASSMKEVCTMSTRP